MPKIKSDGRFETPIEELDRKRRESGSGGGGGSSRSSSGSSNSGGDGGSSRSNRSYGDDRSSDRSSSSGASYRGTDTASRFERGDQLGGGLNADKFDNRNQLCSQQRESGQRNSGQAEKPQHTGKGDNPERPPANGRTQNPERSPGESRKQTETGAKNKTEKPTAPAKAANRPDLNRSARGQRAAGETAKSETTEPQNGRVQAPERRTGDGGKQAETGKKTDKAANRGKTDRPDLNRRAGAVQEGTTRAPEQAQSVAAGKDKPSIPTKNLQPVAKDGKPITATASTDTGRRTPQQRADEMVAQSNGRLVNRGGALTETFRRTSDPANAEKGTRAGELHAMRTAASRELADIKVLLNNPNVARVEVISPPKGERANDLDIHWKDGSRSRWETRTVTAAPGGRLSADGPKQLYQARQERIPSTPQGRQSALASAIESKLQPSRSGKEKQLAYNRTDGFPKGGTLSVHAPFQNSSRSDCDAAMTKMESKLTQHERSVVIWRMERDSGDALRNVGERYTRNDADGKYHHAESIRATGTEQAGGASTRAGVEQGKVPTSAPGAVDKGKAPVAEGHTAGLGAADKGKKVPTPESHTTAAGAADRGKAPVVKPDSAHVATDTEGLRPKANLQGGEVRAALGASLEVAVHSIAQEIASKKLQENIDKMQENSFARDFNAQWGKIEKMIKDQQPAIDALQARGSAVYINVTVSVVHVTGSDSFGGYGLPPGVSAYVKNEVTGMSVSDHPIEKQTVSPLNPVTRIFSHWHEDQLSFSLSYPNFAMASKPVDS